MPAITLEDKLATLLSTGIVRLRRLQGGCVGEVYRAELTDGRTVVVKADASTSPGLDTEGWMLAYLREKSRLPVPEVLHCAPDLLVMEHLPGESRFGTQAQEHAAELVAALHRIRAPRFGLERETLIGGLPQPNEPSDSWLGFFAEQRILLMAGKALEEKKLSPHLYARLESFCSRLAEWLTEPPHPALLHGDLWTTNILAEKGRITGFIDPAVYYGHPEIELAFTTMFGTFGEPFFRRYHEISPIADGFFELRKDLYNLYPLLVHVRLFGSGYIAPIESTLKRIGL